MKPYYLGMITSQIGFQKWKGLRTVRCRESKDESIAGKNNKVLVIVRDGPRLNRRVINPLPHSSRVRYCGECDILKVK